MEFGVPSFVSRCWPFCPTRSNIKIIQQESCNIKPPGEECGVCFQTYLEGGARKAKTLPCGHTFCTLCLVSTISAGVLTCPACRTEHKFPLEGKPDDYETKPSEIILDENPTEDFQEMDSLKGKSLEHLHQVQKDLLERKKTHLEHVARLKNFIEQNKQMIELLDEQQEYVKDAQVTGDVTREQMEKALNKLNGAETDEEIFSVIGEADHCYNNLSNWEQNFENKQPELDDVISRAAELAKTHKAAHAIIGQKYLDESAQWLKDKMKSVYGEESDDEERNDEMEKEHRSSHSIIAQKSIDESSQWLEDKVRSIAEADADEEQQLRAILGQMKLNVANSETS